MSKGTFQYILDKIRDSIVPEIRLAVTLARLTRGEYFYSIGESFGIGVCLGPFICDGTHLIYNYLGETTAQQIHNETIRVIVDNMYEQHMSLAFYQQHQNNCRLYSTEWIFHMHRWLPYSYKVSNRKTCAERLL